MDVIIYIAAIFGIINPVIGGYKLVKTWCSNKIKVVTIKMKKPQFDKGIFTRIPYDNNHSKYVEYENKLRKSAYKDTALLSDDSSLIDDRDMSSSYDLVVVYHKKQKKPLLSARVYWNKEDIMKELRGDKKDREFRILNPITNKYVEWYPNEVDQYELGECFVVDRMSGKFTQELYRHNKNIIFSLLYREIYKRRKNAKVFYALALRSTKESLLSNYIRIGMRVIGITYYFGKQHWVLKGKYDCMYKHFQFIKTLAKEKELNKKYR